MGASPIIQTGNTDTWLCWNCASAAKQVIPWSHALMRWVQNTRNLGAPQGPSQCLSCEKTDKQWQAGSWSQIPHVPNYYLSVRSFYPCSERTLFIPSFFSFSPFKCWVIRFGKWASNLQQKFWKVLFLFCISRNWTHLHPPQYYLFVGISPEKKVFLLTSVRHSPFCTAPWAQTDIQQISKHTCTHKLFLSALLFSSPSCSFHWQNWPRL